MKISSIAFFGALLLARSIECGVSGEETGSVEERFTCPVPQSLSAQDSEQEKVQRLKEEIRELDVAIITLRKRIKANPQLASIIQIMLNQRETERAQFAEILAKFEIQKHVQTATFYEDLIWAGEKTTLFHTQKRQKPYTGWARALYRSGDPRQTEAAIRKLSYYRNGRPWTTYVWKPNGEMCSETTLREGNGVETHWHTNGKKRERSRYRDGLANGKCELWYPNGKMEEEGSYAGGNLHGLVLHYDKSGKILGKATWKDGNPADGTVVKWFGNEGKVRFTFANGELDGNWIRWDAKGRKRAEGNYRKGRRQGVWISFDEQGSEVSRENFGKVE